MATVNIDSSDFEREAAEIMHVLENTELYLRPLALEVMGEMVDRIHNRGLDSDGNRIGTYSTEYLKQRLKNKLGKDADVILVFTRKMSNSWGVFATSNGWAIGFVDDGGAGGVTNLQKLEYAEMRFGKTIQDLTPDEKQFSDERLNEIVNQLLQDYATTSE